jgi:hypothetical protein
VYQQESHVPEVGKAAATVLSLPKAMATAFSPVFVMAYCWAGVSTVTCTFEDVAAAVNRTEAPVA